MAKTFRKPIDKVERGARLAVHRNVGRDTERQEIRNMHRMGWQPNMIEDDDLEDDFDDNLDG